MRRNEILIPPTLFAQGPPSYAQQQQKQYSSFATCDQNGGSGLYEGAIKIMQWEKQVGDRIRAGETILYCEGEESLMGASSNLRVLKELIAEQDGILKEIRVPSGPVSLHTALGIIEPLDIMDVEVESTSTEEFYKEREAKAAAEQAKEDALLDAEEEESNSAPVAATGED